ncbi:MAG: hypothetical protein ABW360_04350 [Phenylobacterium sp.]
MQYAMRKGRRRVSRSKERRIHDHAQFWIEHGEKIRLVFIGGGMVFIAAIVATVALS